MGGVILFIHGLLGYVAGSDGQRVPITIEFA